MPQSVTVIKPAAAVTATRTDYLGGNTATDRTANGATPVAGASRADVIVAVTAQSGTSPTLDVVLEGSADGTNWYTLATVSQYAAAVGVKRTAVATAAVLPPYIRAVSTVAGTTPSFTYSITLLAA